jgi:hypothetical protein
MDTPDNHDIELLLSLQEDYDEQNRTMSSDSVIE